MSLRVGISRCYIFRIETRATGHSVDGSAHLIGGKAGAEQAAIERGQAAFVERAANAAEFAFQALADERGFVLRGEHFVERGFDVAVGHAAPAELLGNAKTSLAANGRVGAREFASVARVIEQLLLLQPIEFCTNQTFILAAAFERAAHFEDRMGAAHERANGGGVKLVGVFGLAGAAHGEVVSGQRRGRRYHREPMNA